MLSDVCHDVEVEPMIQPLSGEILPQERNIREDEAHLDISARGLWGAAGILHTSCTGVASKLTTTFITKLAALLSEKNDTQYSRTICCRLAFALFRASIMCVRGSRSQWHHANNNTSILLASAESGMLC